MSMDIPEEKLLWMYRTMVTTRKLYETMYEMYRHGSSLGNFVSGEGEEAIPAAIEAFVRVAEGTPWKEAGIPGIPARVSQDIRGYYEMAAMEIAGHTPAAWAGFRWFRDHTRTGEVIRAARDAMRDSGAKEPLWRFLMPSDS